MTFLHSFGVEFDKETTAIILWRIIYLNTGKIKKFSNPWLKKYLPVLMATSRQGIFYSLSLNSGKCYD